MSESSNHWSQVRSVAAVVCDGLLAMRAQRREHRRAAQEEAAVPPSWRVRPPVEPAPSGVPEPPRPAPAPPPPEAPPRRATEPALSVEPLILPLPVAPWDMPRPTIAAPPTRGAGHRRDPRPCASAAAVDSSAPSASTPVEPTNSGAPTPSAPGSLTSEAPTSASEPPAQDLTQLSEMVGNLVNLLGDVIGDVVGDALAENARRVEQRHAHEHENLARTIEAAMERQEVRFRAALEQQAQAFAAALDRHVEVQAETVKTIVREVLHDRPAAPVDDPPESTTAETLQELQETLRLGFGEVRSALDRHHRELMEVVRTELRPLARAALTRLAAHSPGVALSDISLAASAVPLRRPPGDCANGRVALAPNARVGPETNDDADPERYMRALDRSRNGPDGHQTSIPAEAHQIRPSQEMSR